MRMLGAPAGLVSGPRMLKMVRTPSSLRTGATFFMAGWWLGANMKPMPISAMHCAICSGLRLMLHAQRLQGVGAAALGDAAPTVFADLGARRRRPRTWHRWRC